MNVMASAKEFCDLYNNNNNLFVLMDKKLYNFVDSIGFVSPSINIKFIGGPYNSDIDENIDIRGEFIITDNDEICIDSRIYVDIFDQFLEIDYVKNYIYKLIKNCYKSEIESEYEDINISVQILNNIQGGIRLEGNKLESSISKVMEFYKLDIDNVKSYELSLVNDLEIMLKKNI